MSWTAIGTFLEFCVTSFPLPLALLIMVIAFWAYWFFKLRPKQIEREEARDKERREQEQKFLEAMARCEESYKHTIIMYEKALENSTRAIENSTAAINTMIIEMKHLREAHEDYEVAINNLERETQESTKQMVKIATLIEAKR